MLDFAVLNLGESAGGRGYCIPNTLIRAKKANGKRKVMHL
jgi:hypothetical protein